MIKHVHIPEINGVRFSEFLVVSSITMVTKIWGCELINLGVRFFFGYKVIYIYMRGMTYYNCWRLVASIFLSMGDNLCVQDYVHTKINYNKSTSSGHSNDTPKVCNVTTTSTQKWLTIINLSHLKLRHIFFNCFVTN